jgi:hypothetical protein
MSRDIQSVTWGNLPENFGKTERRTLVVHTQRIAASERILKSIFSALRGEKESTRIAEEIICWLIQWKDRSAHSHRLPLPYAHFVGKFLRKMFSIGRGMLGDITTSLIAFIWRLDYLGLTQIIIATVLIS